MQVGGDAAGSRAAVGGAGVEGFFVSARRTVWASLAAAIMHRSEQAQGFRGTGSRRKLMRSLISSPVR